MNTIRLEAESLTLAGYVVDPLSFASGGGSAKVPAGTGSISTTLAPDFAAGLYNITIAYFDEGDGQSPMELRVGGNLVDSWILNQDPSPAPYVAVQRKITISQQLSPGMTLELRGTRQAGEYAYVDYIELEPVSTVPPAGNTAPVAQNDSGTTTAQTPLTINVLSNDSDLDGDPLTISRFDSLSAGGGSISLNPNNTLTYSPTATFSGNDRFSYSISDGKGGTSSATVSVAVAAATSPVPPAPAATSKIRLEAESLTLKGYVSEAASVASGGARAKLSSSSGTISTTLAPSFTAGLYNITISYADENDGQSPMELRIGGRLVDSWVFNQDPAVPEGFVQVQRTVSVSQQLGPGTKIELKGIQNKGEFARVDYIELERVGTVPPPTNRAPVAQNDSANTTVQNPITINVLGNDSDLDGDPLTISGFDSRSAGGGTVILNANKTLTYTPTATFSGNDSFSYSISDGKGGTSSATVSVAVAASPPSGSKIRLEAESLTLRGYAVEPTSGASGGARAKLSSGTGTISTTLAPSFTAGMYKITISYADENDGQSPMELRVGGRLVDSWVFNQDPAVPEGFAPVQRTVSVSQQLGPGTAIELKGIQNKGEFARVDYIELERVGSVPPPPPAPEVGGVILNLNTNVELAPVFGVGNAPRLMPLGDSITAGAHSAGPVPGAYRIQFWNRAVADGLAINFVGSENNRSGSLTDGDHAGFPGRTIDQTTAWVRSGNLANYPAEAILLMIGANDANGNALGTVMRDRLSVLIDEITSAVPNTYLLVSPITPFDSPRGTAAKSQNIALYNSLIPALVAQKASQGKKVYLAEAGNTLAAGDMNGDNSFTIDLNDGIHPTADGYNKLGNAWYNAVFNPKPLTGNNLSGTQFADRLIGDSGANVLRGNGGRDQITGGGGADVFAYDNLNHGTDTITDFGLDDIFRVSAARFGGGLVAGMTLDAASFITGSNPAATGGSGAFLYNTASNTLSFDQDGAGGTAAFGMATLTNGYRLQSSQIQVVA
jgi:lysophospholipase L1-like esterase